MPSRRDRAIAGVLLAVYLVANLVVFVILPTVTDSPYWGEPIRDGLGVGLALTVGLPLLVTAIGMRSG